MLVEIERRLANEVQPRKTDEKFGIANRADRWPPADIGAEDLRRKK
jgi:hypothetical protein